MKHFQQLRGLFCLGHQCPVGLDLHDIIQQDAEGIGDCLVTLHRVAHMAGVDQIVVLHSEIGPLGDWLEMIGVKVSRAMHPLLSLQAVDTAEIKLVPQPVAILNGGRVPLRAMSATMGMCRILKGIPASHREDFC